MQKFQVKRPGKQTIDAAKFARKNHPAEIDEKFEELAVRVDTVSAYVMAGVIPCRTGNYVIKHPDGKLDVMPAAEFEEKYEPWAEDVPELQAEYLELANQVAILKTQLEESENKVTALNAGYDQIVTERDELQKKLENAKAAFEEELHGMGWRRPDEVQDPAPRAKGPFGQTPKGK